MNAHDQIMQIVGSRLVNISVANGYENDVVTVTRAKLTPFTGDDIPAINYWSTGMENFDPEPKRYRYDSRVLPVMVEMHTRTRDIPFDTVAASLAADIVTAINRDVAAPAVSDPVSRSLGGTVKRCKFERYDNTIGEGQKPWVGVLVSFSIEFLAENHDMYNFK